MTARDYESTPVSDALDLARVIKGLAQDLEDLRAGTITTDQAVARALLAKQIWNGARIYIAGLKSLQEMAKTVNASKQIEGG